MGRRLLERINMLVKILDYKKGNRGVRFIFKLTNDDTQQLPKYVQFSDHNIAPKKAEHFHIFI